MTMTTGSSSRSQTLLVQPQIVLKNGGAYRSQPAFAPLQFSIHMLARAMYCVGKIDYHNTVLFPYGYSPDKNVRLSRSLRHEWQSRMEFISAYCEPQACSNPNAQELVLSELTSLLDSSEKAVLSYYLGQAMTWLYCHDRLSVKQLIHEIRSRHYFKLYRGNSGRSKPDLIGIDASNVPIVAEAKGTTQFIPSKITSGEIPDKIVDQLCSIQRIVPDPALTTSGRPLPQSNICYFRVGCLAAFRRRRKSRKKQELSQGSPLELYVMHLCCGKTAGTRVHSYINPDDMEDSEQPQPTADDQLESEILFAHLYNIYLTFQATTSSWEQRLLEVEGRRIVASVSDDGRYAIGLLESIAQLIEDRLSDADNKTGNGSKTDEFAGKVREAVPEITESIPSLFNDGSYFNVDWPEWTTPN